MKTDWFKAEDFVWTGHDELDLVPADAETMATLANKRLAEILAEAPVVYGNLVVDVWEQDATDAGHTHRARLVAIEEIK